jgi:DNA-binding MarR family transcriptional regulator
MKKNDLLQAIQEIARSLTHYQNISIKDSGLTAQQFFLLRMVNDAKNSRRCVTRSNLSRLLYTSRTGITRNVQKMVSLGYLEKPILNKNLSLTEEGRKALALAEPLHDVAEKDFLAKMTTAGIDANELSRACYKLLEICADIQPYWR